MISNQRVINPETYYCRLRFFIIIQLLYFISTSLLFVDSINKISIFYGILIGINTFISFICLIKDFNNLFNHRYFFGLNKDHKVISFRTKFYFFLSSLSLLHFILKDEITDYEKDYITSLLYFCNGVLYLAFGTIYNCGIQNENSNSVLPESIIINNESTINIIVEPNPIHINLNRKEYFLNILEGKFKNDYCVIEKDNDILDKPSEDKQDLEAISNTSEEPNSNDKEFCSICLNYFIQNKFKDIKNLENEVENTPENEKNNFDKIFIELNCKHKFDFNCLYNCYINNIKKCPLCRIPFIKN